MTQVDIRVNGRDYRVTCEDGQEERLQQLSAFFDRRVSALSGELGQIGDARLMLLAALTVCDELFEAKTRAANLEEAETPMDMDTIGGASRAVDAAASRIRDMAERLEEA